MDKSTTYVSIPVHGIKTFAINDSDVKQELLDQASKDGLSLNALKGYDYESLNEVSEDLYEPNEVALVASMWEESNSLAERDKILYTEEARQPQLYILPDCDNNQYIIVQVFGDAVKAGEIWKNKYADRADAMDFDEGLVYAFGLEMEEEYGIIVVAPLIDWI